MIRMRNRLAWVLGIALVIGGAEMPSWGSTNGLGGMFSARNPNP